jgi:hypothetical protein
MNTAFMSVQGEQRFDGQRAPAFRAGLDRKRGENLRNVFVPNRR